MHIDRNNSARQKKLTEKTRGPQKLLSQFST